MATSIKLDVDIKTLGALINGRGVPILRRFYTDAKDIVADAGLKELRARALTKPKHPTGRFSRSIVARDLGNSRMLTAEYPPAVYGPWLEGTSERNKRTRFKGYRLFRLTRGRLRKQVGPLVEDRFTQALEELRGGGS
jgi:hypothetical protein